jgi:hypothetical protein
MDTIYTKKLFKQGNDDFKCDLCHGLGPNPLSFNSIMREMNCDEEVEKNLAMKYLDFDDCEHKVCFKCIEHKSDNHGISLPEIECQSCESEERYKIEQENKLNYYCHCPESVYSQMKEKYISDSKPKKPLTEMDIFAMNMNIMRIFGLGLGSGLPLPTDTCDKCNKDKYLYIGIDDNMNKLYPERDWENIDFKNQTNNP